MDKHVEEKPQLTGARLDESVLSYEEHKVEDESGHKRCIGDKGVGNFLLIAEYHKHPLTLVNREDDSGEMGLRKAKMSYVPYRIVHKYQAEMEK